MDRPTYPIDWRKWGVYKRNEQIQEDVARFKNITIGGESALEVGVAVATAAGETFFGTSRIWCHWTSRSARGAPQRSRRCRRTTWRTRQCALMKEDGRPKTVPRPALEEVGKELEKLGAVADGHGSVEGPLKDDRVPPHLRPYVELALLMIPRSRRSALCSANSSSSGRILGNLSEIVEDGVDCSFGNRDEAEKSEGLASDKAGNFGSNARDGAPLCEEHQDPRNTRFAIAERTSGAGALEPAAGAGHRPRPPWCSRMPRRRTRAGRLLPHGRV